MRSGVAIAFLTLAVAACSTTSRQGLPPLETVAHVDLGRYVGRWYEIASFPRFFQSGCVGTTALYSIGGNGEIFVINQCREDSFTGDEKMAAGVARVVDTASNAKLEVSFLWPFWGDYWIIDLDPDYRWAVVGDPGRDSLWILSRDPAIDDATYDAITERAKKKGFDISRLQRTKQDVAPRPD